MPSFVAVSRMPSAFEMPMASNASRVRPAGDTVEDPNNPSDTACSNNTYRSVRFYTANQLCINVNDYITQQAYNQYGYPIDSNGNPQTSGTPASWAILGASGQAWEVPNTGELLDASGNSISARQAAHTNMNIMSNCQLDSNGRPVVPDANGTLVPIPSNAVGCTSGGLPVDANNQIISVPAASAPGSFGTPTAVTPNPLVPVNPATPQNQSLYSAVGPALNTTGQAISSAIATNNQMQLAQMRSATALQIAQLQAGIQQANAAGNVSLAQQQLAQLGPLQQFQAQLQAVNMQTTALYVAAGAVALGLIGAIIYFKSADTSQPVSATRADVSQSATTTASRSATIRNNPFGNLTKHVRAVRSIRASSKRRRS